MPKHYSAATSTIPCLRVRQNDSSSPDADGPRFLGATRLEKYMLPTRTLLVALAFTASAGTFAQIPGQTFPTPSAATVTQSATGFDATLGAETMRVTVCADTIVHVVTRPPEIGRAHV